MFGSKPTTQKLVHLPGPPNPSRSPNQELPQGQCLFILREVDADGTRKRCDCVSFTLNQTLPGSQCGCTHQAWHHVKEPTGDYVPMQEYMAVVERCAHLEDQSRKLSDDLSKEKMERERLMKDVQQANYQNMVYLRYYFDEKMERLRIQADDKIEGIEDKAQGALDETKDMRLRMEEIDEVVMRLEERLDSGRRASRSLTPLLESASTAVQSPPPERRELYARSEPPPESKDWDVRIVLLPSRHLQFAPNMDSVTYKRCQTRGFVQDIHLPDRTSACFLKAIEASFGSILRMRTWMPLQCLKSSDMSICQLMPNQIDPALWDYVFLEQLCLAHDKAQGDIIYISLQSEDLSWTEIQSLPSIFGSDESCWANDEKREASNAMDYRMESNPPVTDTDSTYEKYHSPPPYQPDTPRQGPMAPQSPLEVLADASLAGQDRAAPSISERSNYSAPSMVGSIHSGIGSIDSTISGGTEHDEHRDKRTKRHQLRPHTQGSSSASLGAQSAPSSPPASKIVYSGRTKRKLQSDTKYREPMDWRPSEHFKGLLHRHDSKEKRPQTSGSQHST